MLKILFLNRKIEDLFNQNLSKNLLNKNLKDLLKKNYPERIRPDLMEKIKIVLGDEIKKFEYINTISFKPVTSEIGKTYVLFVDNSSNHNLNGYCFILKVSIESNKEQNESQNKFISAYKSNIDYCFDYVARIIENELKDSFFFKGIKDKLTIKILDPFNEPLNFSQLPNLEFSGNSIELPMAVAIFSALTGMKIDSSIACSGNINENLEVTYVDGMREKILGASKEFPEIKTFVFPEDCRKLNIEKEFNGIEIKYVRTLTEALQLFFGNYDKFINENYFNGKIDLKIEEVLIEPNSNALKIFLDYDYGQGNLDPKILKFFSESKLDSKLKKYNSRIYLLDNFRPLWFVPALMRFFVNKSDAVGVHNKESDVYIIVYTGRNFNKFEVGDIVRIKK